jgi:hypothetical protein
MKKSIVIIQLLFACSVLYASADFIPSVPEGGEQVPGSSSGMVKYNYQNMAVQQIAAFFMHEFKENANISFREIQGKGEIVINDWGNSKWQKIHIAVNGDAGTIVTITKDSWTWILGTLVIRFVGVFVVLTVLLIVLNILSAIVSRSLSNLENKGKPETVKQGS